MRICYAALGAFSVKGGQGSKAYILVWRSDQCIPKRRSADFLSLLLAPLVERVLLPTNTRLQGLGVWHATDGLEPQCDALSRVFSR